MLLIRLFTFNFRVKSRINDGIGGFFNFDECLVFIPINKLTSINFVNVVYEGCSSGFNFMYNDPNSLLLMEDGALVHKGSATAC